MGNFCFFWIGLICMIAGLVFSLFQHDPAATASRWVSIFALPFISAIGVVQGAWLFLTVRYKKPDTGLAK